MVPANVNEARIAVKSKLRAAVQELRARGLQKAVMWTLEQIDGIETQDTTTSSCNTRIDVYSGISDEHMDTLMLAKSLLDAGEYQRCAHFLHSKELVLPSLLNAGKAQRFALFLCSYARYMSGEKLREQTSTERRATAADADADAAAGKKAKNPDKNETDHKPASRNSNLQAIYSDLRPLYLDGSMRGDGFLLYIFAVVVRDLHRQYGASTQEVLAAVRENQGEGEGGNAAGTLSARSLFLQSIQAYPWNWSCWLELAELCVAEKQALPTWPEITALCCPEPPAASADSSYCGTGHDLGIAELQEAKVMYACFLVHAYLEKHCGDLAMQVIQAAVLPIMPRSLVVHTQVGLAQYTLRQYDEAEASFEAVRAADPYRLQCMDTYSNILYVKEKHADLARLTHAVIEVEKFCPESCCVVGNHYSLKGKHERAVLYFQRAIKLNSRYLSAWTLMGHEFMELRNTTAAVQCYRNAVALSEVDYRAWYGLGQTYEMLHLYQYAHFYYRKAAFLRPLDARMWGAVGNCLLKLGLREQAILSFQRAVGCGDLEGIATRDLARLCREEGQTTRAAQYYFKFLQISQFFSHDPASAADGVGGMEGCGDSQDPHRTAPRRANSADGHGSAGSGSDALLSAVLNTTAAGGEQLNSSAYISRAVSALMQQQQVRSDGGAGLLTGSGVEGGAVVTAVDGEQAEALLYLAHYHRNVDLAAAKYFCGRLQGYMGSEGEEARAMLRSILASEPIAPGHAQGATAGSAGSGRNSSAPSSASSAGASGRRGRAQQSMNVSNVSAFSRTSTRRQSAAFGFDPDSSAISGVNTTPNRPRTRAGASFTSPGERLGGGDASDIMTPSQSLQMEYTGLSLSPGDSSPSQPRR